jgi:glycosyltransferase involved in cell wall biosynthesis
MIVKKIGIECENLEGERFGVGHTMAQLLETITKVPGIQKKYKFVLYFKNKIPKDDFLKHPVFKKKILKIPGIPPSFNIFYHILLPFYFLKDRLDFFFFPSYMLPAFFFSKKAIVVLTNDVWWEAHHGSLPFRYKLSYRLFSKWAAVRAKKIMTISEFSKKELMKFYNLPEEKIFVNYWGLSDQFTPLEKNPENLKRLENIKHNLRIKKDFIISVGQAFPRRRTKEAMQTFAKIAEKYPDIQYLVPCTDKNNPPVLDELAKKINKKLNREAIVRTKYLDREDLIYLFNFAKLLIYVSETEALGLPPAEALKCGVPSVVKDNRLTREIFGNNAFFVKDAENIEDFSEVLEEALTNVQKREEILQNREESLAKLDWKKHIEKFITLLNEV